MIVSAVAGPRHAHSSWVSVLHGSETVRTVGRPHRGRAGERHAAFLVVLEVAEVFSTSDSEGARSPSLIPRIRLSRPGLSSCRTICGAAMLPTRATHGAVIQRVRGECNDLQNDVITRVEGLTVLDAVGR